MRRSFLPRTNFGGPAIIEYRGKVLWYKSDMSRHAAAPSRNSTIIKFVNELGFKAGPDHPGPGRIFGRSAKSPNTHRKSPERYNKSYLKKAKGNLFRNGLLKWFFARCELRPFFGSHAHTSHVHIKVRTHRCAHTQFEEVALRTRTRTSIFFHQFFSNFSAIFQHFYGLGCS
jgi:hypothetical protein